MTVLHGRRATSCSTRSTGWLSTAWRRSLQSWFQIDIVTRWILSTFIFPIFSLWNVHCSVLRVRHHHWQQSEALVDWSQRLPQSQLNHGDKNQSQLSAEFLFRWQILLKRWVTEFWNTGWSTTSWTLCCLLTEFLMSSGTRSGHHQKTCWYKTII